MRFPFAGAIVALACSVSPVLGQTGPISVHIEELTQLEVRDAIASGMTTVIIPTGGVENNGPHLVTGKHNFVVRWKAEHAAKLLGDALVAPVMAYVPEGNVESVRFAYITTPEPVFIEVLVNAAKSLRSWGFTDIAFIGDSGGNQNGQLLAAEALNAEWAGTNARAHHISDYYPGRGDAIAATFGLTAEEIGGHAGSQDTSSFMYIDPSKLRFDPEHFVPGVSGDGQGHTGDPRKATAAMGKMILEAQSVDAANQIKALRTSSRR